MTLEGMAARLVSEAGIARHGAATGGRKRTAATSKAPAAVAQSARHDAEQAPPALVQVAGERRERCRTRGRHSTAPKASPAVAQSAGTASSGAVGSTSPSRAQTAGHRDRGCTLQHIALTGAVGRAPPSKAQSAAHRPHGRSRQGTAQGAGQAPPRAPAGGATAAGTEQRRTPLSPPLTTSASFCMRDFFTCMRLETVPSWVRGSTRGRAHGTKNSAGGRKRGTGTKIKGTLRQ